MKGFLRSIHVYYGHIILFKWSPDCNIVTFIVSYYSFCLRVCFVWYKYAYSCFLLVSASMKYLFHTLLLSAMYVFTNEVRFLQVVYCWVLFLYPSTCCLDFSLWRRRWILSPLVWYISCSTYEIIIALRLGNHIPILQMRKHKPQIFSCWHFYKWTKGKT